VHRAFDHRGDLGRGARDELRVDRHGLGVHMPVDEHAAAAVADVVLGEQVLVERPEVRGVRRDRPGPGTPDQLAAGGEGGVGDRRGEPAGALGGQVAAPHVAQVVLGVGVLPGPDRAEPDVGAVPEDAQDQPLGQRGPVEAAARASGGEVFDQPDAQHCLLEHVQQRHQPPPSANSSLSRRRFRGSASA
jgi:hypothetical protein